MKLSTILGQIDMGSLALPKFQRGFVWQRRQVRNLMRSLCKGYPIGSLLIWETRASAGIVRGGQQLAASSHKLLLDGQQRVTSLYGIIRGAAPPFFDGDEKVFLNLYFNLDNEEFEFYGPVKMRDDPKWISITELMQGGIGPFITRLANQPEVQDYLERLNNITQIKERNILAETVSGVDEINDIVDIFNQVNSGGTKLSKGDLALAKIGADWPEARREMQACLQKWEGHGFRFNLDWLLRCVNALLTGQADFSFLSDDSISTADIQGGLKRAEKHIDNALNLIAGRLGLDDQYLLRSPNSLPAIVRYFDKVGGLPDTIQQSKLLYWYIQTMLWGRYSSQIETVIRQDLLTIDKSDDALATLISRMRQYRRDLRVYPDDLEDWSRGSRFYPLLYMLTRVYGARDFGSGIPLSKHLLGGMNRLELHHIFPKSKLSQHGFTTRAERNSLANFTFLTKQTNLEISAKDPEIYFEQYEGKHPGVLASHWIPLDRDLWQYKNYPDFLAERRKLLAQAANDFLYRLRHGTLPASPAADRLPASDAAALPANIASEAEEAVLHETMNWLERQGLPRGEYAYELVEDNELIAIIDLAWPDGIQTGLSQPVALMIDESEETLDAVRKQGYVYFKNAPALRRYVETKIIGQ